MSALEKMETSVVAIPAATSPMRLLEIALEKGSTVDALEKLIGLQERLEETQARKAYIAAMALARAKFKPLIKRHSGYNDRYKYETISDVSDAVDEALTENGFNYDWGTEDLPDGNVRVTCVVTHDMGYSRKNSLSISPKEVADPKANMNAAQRLLAAVTYLQRGTLKAALGIAASKDTDGETRDKIIEGSATVTPDEFIFLNNLIDETGAVEAKVLASVGASTLETMTQKQYREAVSKLQAWVKKAKQEVKPQ